MKERDEERQLAELQRMQEEQTGKKKVDKLDWMYAAPASGGGIKGDELEDYLLGKRRVDKILQGDEEKAVSITFKLSGEGRRDRPEPTMLTSSSALLALQVAAAQANTIANEKANTARDTAAKIREDPLLAIKQQEQAAYQALLANPHRLKQLQEKAGLKAGKKDEKKKEKDEKRRRKEERRERRARGEKEGRSESPELELGEGGIGEALDRRERERGYGGSSRRERSRSPRRYDERDRTPRRRDDYNDRRLDHYASSSSSSRYPSSSSHHRDRSPPRFSSQYDRPSSSSHSGPSSSSSYNRPPPPHQQYQSRPTAADYNSRYGGGGAPSTSAAGPSLTSGGGSEQAAKLEADRKARLDAMMGNASEMSESPAPPLFSLFLFPSEHPTDFPLLSSCFVFWQLNPEPLASSRSAPPSDSRLRLSSFTASARPSRASRRTLSRAWRRRPSSERVRVWRGG